MSGMAFLVEAVWICLVAYSYGHTFKVGGCPKVKVMKDFDMNEFTGEWFVVARFNPVATCAKLNIEKTPEGFFMFQESSRPFGMNLGTDNSSRKGRKIIILRNDTDAVFKVQRRFPFLGRKTFGAVDTDYVSYALIWSCDSLLVGTVRNLDVLSRTPQVDMPFIKEASDRAILAGINVRPLENVDHSKCVASKDEIANRMDNINNMYVV